MKKKTILLSLSEEFHKALKVKAAKMGISLTALINNILKRGFRE
jgi:predicted HicB family RNase H-like nuclease